MYQILIASLVALLLGTPAHARPWTVLDLGHAVKDEFCMQAARRTFQSVRAEFGAKRLRASNWVNFADQVAGKHDAMITCNYAGSGSRATLVVHSVSRPIDVHFIAQRIVILFDEYNAGITKTWRESF